MEEYEIIGKLDLKKLGKYEKLVVTDEVILTNERKQHVMDKHIGHYELLKEHIQETIYSPDYILEDIKNRNTIIILKEIIKNEERIKMIVKLSTNKLENRLNSIITFWNIREKDYNKTIEKNKIIYKKLDKEE